MMDAQLLAGAREVAFWTHHRLQLTIPSILATDEGFRLRVTAFGADGLPAQHFAATIEFLDSPGIHGLPESIRMVPGDEGCTSVPNLRATGAPAAHIVARVAEGPPRELRSNPSWVFDEPPYRLYWGDLHSHSTYSNCSAWAAKDPEFAYAYARYFAHLDFAAMADHLHGIAASPERWPRLQALARDCYEPGQLVPLLAFESSHQSGYGGDNNAYFAGTDAPYFWLDGADMTSTNPAIHLGELWRFLDEAGAEHITVPHHTGRAAKYRSFADPVYDPEREPLFEIFSTWGSSEARLTPFPLSVGNSDLPCYFQDALRAGCRFGVIASSDDHLTLPGGEGVEGRMLGPRYLSLYMHNGLAAVRAPALSRPSLWHSLRTRNCYATTFSRSLLDVRIGDLQMGDQSCIDRSDSLHKTRRIHVNHSRTLDFRSPTEIVLLRNGEEIQRAQWSPDQPEVIFEDQARLDEVAIRDSLFHPEPFVVYYVRVDAHLGDTQWSSPIWLDL